MQLEPVTIEEQQNPFALALEPVWEKVRAATVLLASLRQEKKQLEERIGGLEEEVQRSTRALAEQAEELALLKADYQSLETTPHGQVQCPVVLGTEERLHLQQKIKTALTKIDTYLAAP